MSSTVKATISGRPLFVAAIVISIVISLTALPNLFRQSAETQAPGESSPISSGEASSPTLGKYSNAPRSKGERFAGAVGGQAFILEMRNGQVVKTPIRTSRSVFKTFGLSDDGTKLLYTELKDRKPTGALYLEDITTGESSKVTVQTVLSAAMSPTDPSKIAYTFTRGDAFALAVVDVSTGVEQLLKSNGIFAEAITWDEAGDGVHYFETTVENDTMFFPTPESPEEPFGIFDVTGSRRPAGQLSTDMPNLTLTPKFASLSQQRDLSDLPEIPEGFPKIGKNVLPSSSRKFGNDSLSVPSYEFDADAPAAPYRVHGKNLTGFGELSIQNTKAGSESRIGEGQLVGMLSSGAVVKRLEPNGTRLEFVDWTGKATALGTTSVGFHIPVKNSKMTQGGASYSSPANCNLTAHFDAMGYAYDFEGALNSHALASADGLVVFAHQTTTCNFISTTCPDYSSTGCPGYFLGNQIVIQHADGTYTVFSHLAPNSFQAAVGTTVCQGLYVARQGHTGATGSLSTPCSDHVHFQRQATPDYAGQSIPVSLDESPGLLSCGTNYTSLSTEISNTISSTTRNFTQSGGTGTVNVTSTGCTWSAFSNVPWVTITAPGSGSGNGTVGYSVAGNSDSPRTGTLNIGGQTFTVTQDGSGPANTAPVVSAGPDQSVLVTDVAALHGTVTDDGVGPGPLTSNWTKLRGPGTVAFGNPGLADTTATFSMAGVYELRLTSSDGDLSAQDDVIVVVGVANGGGSLTGSTAQMPSSVNLTAEGTDDWAHWGLTSATDFDHKNSANRLISNFTSIGSITPVRFTSNPTAFSWSNGSPTSSANTTTGVSTYADGSGFEISVPADSTPRRLKIYVSTWRCTGRLEATLSDGSSTPFVDTSVQSIFVPGSSSTPAAFAVYVLNFRSSSASQTLNVRWTVTNPSYPVGNATLQAATLVTVSNLPPTVNAGADQSVVVPGPASLAGSAADDGLPNPPAAVTTAWSVVSGPGTVTFGNAAQASTSASFSAAGTYVLRLTASDGALTSSDDVTVTVSPAGSGGSLSVSGAAPPAGVNLSAEGTADWAHWGLTSPSSFDHKAAVTPQISNYTTLGGGSALQYSNSPIAYTWSGGTPTSAATGTPTGVWVFGTGAGFQVTVPADASQRTLKVYAGVWSAGGKFEATLSDASAPAYTDTSLVNQTGASDRVYTVAYRAASPGQTLTVRWTANSTYNTYGNVTLQGATLF